MTGTLIAAAGVAVAAAGGLDRAARDPDCHRSPRDTPTYGVNLRSKPDASDASARKRSGSLLITGAPPVIEPRSEPTNFGKATGHGFVNQPQESLALRSLTWCVNIRGNLNVVYQRRELRALYV
jgi:hypothetical protein